MITSGYDPTKYDYGGKSTPNNVPIVSIKSGNLGSGNAPKPEENVGESTIDTKAAPEKSEPEKEVSEASSVTNNDTMQDNVMHDKSGTYKSKTKSSPRVKKKVTSASIQIRDFPRDVMDIVRGIVPGGNSYVETLLAYIYVTSPVKFDIPDSVQSIVDAYEQDDAFCQVLKEIRLLREQMRNIEVVSYQGTLASEYHLFRSMKSKDPNTAIDYTDIKYLAPGVEDIHIALEEDARHLKKKDVNRHGRKKS